MGDMCLIFFVCLFLFYVLNLLISLNDLCLLRLSGCIEDTSVAISVPFFFKTGGLNHVDISGICENVENRLAKLGAYLPSSNPESAVGEYLNSAQHS